MRLLQFQSASQVKQDTEQESTYRRERHDLANDVGFPVLKTDACWGNSPPQVSLKRQYQAALHLHPARHIGHLKKPDAVAVQSL